MFAYSGLAVSAYSTQDKAAIKDLISRFEAEVKSLQAGTGYESTCAETKPANVGQCRRNSSFKMPLYKVIKSATSSSPSHFYKINVQDMYQRFPAMEALVDMYIVTSKLNNSAEYGITMPNTHYLSHAINMGELYFLSEDGYTDGFKQWKSGAGCNSSTNCHHYEFRAAAGVAKLLLATGPYGEFKVSKSSYAYKASRRLALQLYNQVWKKWTRTGGKLEGLDTNYIKNATATDAISRAGIVARALYNWADEISLHDSTKTELFDYLVTINQSSKVLGSPQVRNGKSYYPIPAHYTSLSRLSDISHARDNVSYAMVSHFDDRFDDGNPRNFYKYLKYGINMNSLYNSVASVVWDGNTSNPSFKDYVNPYNTTKTYNGTLQGSWVKLARYDSRLRQAYYNMVKSQGGVACFGDYNLRHDKANLFGNGVTSVRCNYNTSFSQLQLLAGLTTAYIYGQ